MKVTVLLENSTPTDRFCAEHGLSLFLETEGHRILFDMGPSAAFIGNAKAMGIDVGTADIAFLSHGHFDHGGGLPAFLALTAEQGSPAPIYLRPSAAEPHRAKTPAGLKDIGIDGAVMESDRIRLADELMQIDDELTVFSAVEPVELAPASNRVLLAETADGFAPDPFDHELSLLVSEGGKTTLVTGCSHCGIVNIVKRAEQITGGPLHAVVAGFHLMNPASGEVEDAERTRAVAEFLASRPTRYFTFHCTGLAAYILLRDTLGDRITYLYTSSTAEI